VTISDKEIYVEKLYGKNGKFEGKFHELIIKNYSM
jgi:hypothetical protein